MKKLSVIAASLLISTGAFAATHTYHDVTRKHVGDYQSKEAAYQAGFDYINQLGQMSQSKLKYTLPSVSNSMVKNVAVDESDVSLKEVASAPGQIKYRATVNVKYHFQAHDDNS